MKSAAPGKKVASAQGAQQGASGSSWFKPWTWGAKKVNGNAPQAKGPQISEELPAPVPQYSPTQMVSSRPHAMPKPDLEEEKVDAEVLESARQTGINAGQDTATVSSKVAPPSATATPPVKFGPLTQRQDFKKNVWSGYDRKRHLLPGETPRVRHDLGPGGREPRIPVHEDPKFNPSPEYMQRLAQELQEQPGAPKEMIKAQEPRPSAAPTITAAGAMPLGAEKPTAADASSYESGSADNLRIMFERLGLDKRGR